MIKLLSVLVLFLAGEALAASSITIHKQPVATAPYYVSAGWNYDRDILLNRAFGNEGLCQVKDQTTPFAWTDINAPGSITEMVCKSIIPDYSAGQVMVSGSRRTDTGNFRAFVGSINTSTELPPFPGASADNSSANGLWFDPDALALQVVGSSVRADGRTVAYWWSEDAPTVLTDTGCPNQSTCDGSPWTGSEATKIEARFLPNLDPRMVGNASSSNGWQWATFFSGTQWKTLPQGFFGNDKMGALDINGAATAIVGFSGLQNGTAMDPAIWLGSFNSWEAYLLPEPVPAWCPSNHIFVDRGEVVNKSGKIIWGGSHCGEAFISIISQTYVSPPISVQTWLEAGGVDFTGIEQLDQITGIEVPDWSEDGEIYITGTGQDTSGKKFAFDAVIELPEPNAGLGMVAGSGLLGLLSCKRRERQQPNDNNEGN